LTDSSGLLANFARIATFSVHFMSQQRVTMRLLIGYWKPFRSCFHLAIFYLSTHLQASWELLGGVASKSSPSPLFFDKKVRICSVEASFHYQTLELKLPVLVPSAAQGETGTNLSSLFLLSSDFVANSWNR
jgi:hypothetical protein